MKNSFPYQFLLDAYMASEKLIMPSFLKKIVKEGDLAHVKNLEDFFASELQNASLQNQQEVEYFLFIANQNLRYYFHKRDLGDFQETLEKVRHRMLGLRSVGADINMKAWEALVQFLDYAFLRLVKNITIEDYEKQIDAIEWGSLDPVFISQISTAIGYVYLYESDPVQASKARLWLQKSINDSSETQNLGNHLLMARHFLNQRTPEAIEQVEAIIKKLRSSEIPPNMKPIFHSAAFELEATLASYPEANFDDEKTLVEHCEQNYQRIKSHYNTLLEQTHLPSFTQQSIEYSLASMEATLFHLRGEIHELNGTPPEFITRMNKLISSLEEQHDTSGGMHYRLAKCRLVGHAGLVLPEKEVREVVQFYKKSRDYATFLDANEAFAQIHENNANSVKSFDLIMDIMKMGQKRMEEGGFYLIVKGFALANQVFLKETKQPGVSWMIEKLHGFFEKITEVIDTLDENLDLTGRALVEEFRTHYLSFEPASNFHIQVYFRYQLYQLKSMRIGAIMYEDALSLQLAEKLISGLEHKNNPLMFISGEWDEFKKVPNSVRNRTLNKCINISKGDLPLAAEHLDFSYRNLRSYITFKEVNRLGFFLDIQETNNRQLEQGIRLMFYDLYKKGTIFEVVFDMPKFLVNHAQSGFFSQDLEQSLNIKGTTAKKYIKIMMEIELIRQDKTMGRKHFYHLNRDKVMTRLGRDQATLIKSEG